VIARDLVSDHHNPGNPWQLLSLICAHLRESAARVLAFPITAIPAIFPNPIRSRLNRVKSASNWVELACNSARLFPIPKLLSPVFSDHPMIRSPDHPIFLRSYPPPPGYKPFQSTSIQVNPEVHISQLCIAPDE
jgi:hypothetical protein